MTDAPDERARWASVGEALRQAAGTAGTLRFDHFLEIALYHPEIGYYAHAGRQIGASGDFYTAAQLGPLLGATLARRVRAEFERLGRPASFRVVEVGAGDGSLAAAVAAALADDPVMGAADFEYVVIEPSVPLARQLHDRLRSTARPAGLRWRAAPAVSSDGPFAGVVLANEVLDALPSRRLVAVDGSWHEQGVRWEHGSWRFADLGPADPVPSPALAPPAEEGAVFELNVLAEGFMREIADHLARGCAVLLDYGDDGAGLRARFASGSLTAFRDHRVLEDPLDAPGSADLSTFVDFDRVRAASTRAGLAILSYGPQAERLGEWGLGEVGRAWIAAAASDAAERVRRQLLLKNLSFGFSNFRVLELGAPA